MLTCLNPNKNRVEACGKQQSIVQYIFENQFVFAKYHALLSYKLTDISESKKWIGIAKNLAEKEGVDLKSDAEFKWLMDSIGNFKG